MSRLKRCRSTSSSMSSSSIECINEVQYLGLNSKKQKVDNSLSIPSNSEVVKQQGYSVSDDGVEKIKGGVGNFSDSKAARVEALKKRFGRIIVKATEFQVEDRRRDDHHKVDSVEMQRKKNQILEKKLKEADIVAEAELKMELQRKREAAKKALVELERSVQVDDNATTMKDFTVMLGYPRNCTAYLCNEIGWYGTPVYSKRRTTS